MLKYLDMKCHDVYELLLGGLAKGILCIYLCI